MSPEIITGIATMCVIGYVIIGTLVYTWVDVAYEDEGMSAAAGVLWPVMVPIMLTRNGVITLSRWFRERLTRPRSPEVPKATAREVRR